MCGNPGVQKVTAIYRTGNWSSTRKGSGVGLTSYSGGGYSSSYMTIRSEEQGTSALAAQLAPPQLSTPLKSTTGFVMWVVALGSGVVTLNLMSEGLWGALVVALPVLGVAVFGIGSGAAEGAGETGGARGRASGVRGGDHVMGATTLL